MATVDIFNPLRTKIAKGLEGKSFLIYGSNSTGKTSQAVRMSKPFVIATESGLNATNDIPYYRVTRWKEMQDLIKQFTDKKTVEQARAMYDTIIVDEIYAASLLCQDYCIQTYGEGALTLGDSQGKVNLYQMYEKIFFKAVNTLLSCGYTVVFIGHAQKKDGEKIQPKGDKRCVDPIKDWVDYVIYVESNGVDDEGRVIPSSAYLAETNDFFARSRFDTTPTYLPEWSAEALEEAVNIGIKGKEAQGAKTVTFAEQKAQNTSVAYDYDEVMDALQEVGQKFAAAGKMEDLTEVVEDTLGKGKKVSECTKKQLDAMVIILDNLHDRAEELGI